jgi:dTDP-4-dehydrorhamnose reductase
MNQSPPHFNPIFDRILITGGEGMLAGAFKDVLAMRGQSCTAPGHAPLDVTDASQIQTLFKEVQPTLVLNCAAYTKVDLCEQHPQQAEQVNGRAVGLLAQACSQTGAWLVHFSTDYVFDGSKRQPWRVEDPTEPINAYGRSKLLGETLLRQSALRRWMLVRTAWLYGPHGPNFVQTILRAARSGRPLEVVADQVGSPTYTLDLAEATLSLLHADAAGLYHLTNAGQASWFEFAQAILRTQGLSVPVSPLSSDQWRGRQPQSAVRPAWSVLDCSAAERVLGRPMRPWIDALSAYAQRDRSL